MSRTYLREVFFRWEEDCDSGEWGLMPIHPYYIPSDRAEFNVVREGYMIFHDVFEHYFEGQKPFTGEACFNVGGEVAAMGHFFYYVYHGVDNRVLNPNSQWTISRSAADTVTGELENGFQNGYTGFGSSFECPITQALPRIEELRDVFHEQEKILHYLNKEYRKDLKGREYRKSCTLSKFKKLYTWDYLQAKHLVDTRCRKTGESKHFVNINLLYEFIQDWNEFFEKNTLHEQYRNVIDKIRIRVWREQAMLCWDAKFFVNQDINIEQRDRDEPEYKDFTWRQGDERVPILHHKFEWLAW